MADIHEKARAERLRRMEVAISIAETCECDWPLVVYRNGTGHHPTCPAYTLPVR